MTAWLDLDSWTLRHRLGSRATSRSKSRNYGRIRIYPTLISPYRCITHEAGWTSLIMPSLFSRFKHKRSGSTSTGSSPASSPRTSQQGGRPIVLSDSTPSSPSQAVAAGQGSRGEAVVASVPVVTHVPVVGADGLIDENTQRRHGSTGQQSPVRVKSARHAPAPPSNANREAIVIGTDDQPATLHNPAPVIPSAIEILKPHPNLVSSEPLQGEVRDVQGRKNRPNVSAGHQYQSEEATLGGGEGEDVSRHAPQEPLDVPQSRKAGKPSGSPCKNLGNDEGLAEGVAGLSLEPKSKQSMFQQIPVATQSLEEQRLDLINRITEESAERSKTYSQLNAAGREVFKAAGIGHLADKKGDVDIVTRWLKPVVQETIRKIEHIEYTTIHHRHVHIHHIQ